MKRTHFRLAAFASLVLMLVGGNVFAGCTLMLSHHSTLDVSGSTLYDVPDGTIFTVYDTTVINNTISIYDDGGVGIVDLDDWLNNWNAGPPPGAVIPEPSSAAVLGVIGVAGVCRRRR